MSNTAPSRADPVVVFPYSRWCPPQETSQPHPPQGDREDIFITHLFIITKSEVWTFHIVVIFLRGCVSEVVIPSYAFGFVYIYIPGQLGFVLLLCSLMMCTNNRVHYGLMVVLVCLHITLLHYHNHADVSGSIEIYNACQVHSV